MLRLAAYSLLIRRSSCSLALPNMQKGRSNPRCRAGNLSAECEGRVSVKKNPTMGTNLTSGGVRSSLAFSLSFLKPYCLCLYLMVAPSGGGDENAGKIHPNRMNVYQASACWGQRCAAIRGNSIPTLHQLGGINPEATG